MYIVSLITDGQSQYMDRKNRIMKINVLYTVEQELFNRTVPPPPNPMIYVYERVGGYRDKEYST